MRRREASQQGDEVGALMRRVADLRVDVDAKGKKWDYMRVSVEEAKRRLFAARAAALRTKDDDRAALGRRRTAWVAEDRERRAADSSDDAVRLLHLEAADLRARRNGFGARIRAAEAAVRRDDGDLAQVLKRLHAVAQRRSAALAGDDADAPWRRAADAQRHAAACLEAVRDRQTGADERRYENDLEDLREELEALEKRLDNARAERDRTKRRAEQWREAHLAHVAAGHEDEARYAATELGRVLRACQQTQTAARHALRANDLIAHDVARFEALARPDARYVQEYPPTAA